MNSLAHSGSPEKEHHARLVQACQLAGLSSKSTCNILLHLEFRVHFWLVYSCVQFAVPADWEAPGWVLFSSR